MLSMIDFHEMDAGSRKLHSLAHLEEKGGHVVPDDVYAIYCASLSEILPPPERMIQS